VWGGHSCPTPLTLKLVEVSCDRNGTDGSEQFKIKSGGQECPPHTGLLALFFFFVVKVEPEGWMVASSSDLDGQFSLSVLSKERVKGLQQE
jgi:hypothetical protein